MSRIFFTLGIFALLLMTATLSIGLYLGDYRERLRQLNAEIRALQPQVSRDAAAAGALTQAQERGRKLLRWSGVHMLMGVGTSLVVILVNCISVTYFIGTGRWCREVTETYQLDPALPARSQQLKRRSFPWATLGILSALIVSALGAAADPFNGVATSEHWPTVHLLAALTGFVLIAWAFFVQWGNICEHHAVIEEIVTRVGEVRRQRGLET